MKNCSTGEGSGTNRTCLLIGASRGLGLAIVAEYLARGWDVTATLRGGRTDPHDLAAAAGDRLVIEKLDINSPDEFAALRERLAGQVFNQLFVNGGIANDPRVPISIVTTEEFFDLMVTNALSPLRVVEALAELVTANGGIGLMSSGLAFFDYTGAILPW